MQNTRSPSNHLHHNETASVKWAFRKDGVSSFNISRETVSTLRSVTNVYQTKAKEKELLGTEMKQCPITRSKSIQDQITRESWQLLQVKINKSIQRVKCDAIL